MNVLQVTTISLVPPQKLTTIVKELLSGTGRVLPHLFIASECISPFYVLHFYHNFTNFITFLVEYASETVSIKLKHWN